MEDLNRGIMWLTVGHLSPVTYWQNPDWKRQAVPVIGHSKSIAVQQVDPLGPKFSHVGVPFEKQVFVVAWITIHVVKRSFASASQVLTSQEIG